MEYSIKKVETLYCPKCGGEIIEDKQYGIGRCLHCEAGFLLNDEEMAILKKQDIESTVLHGNSADIVSELCASNKSWVLASDYMFVSESMKKSIFHKGKAKKVQKNWRIPPEDDIFLIADSGVKPFSKGFALSTSGLYYVENSFEKRGKMSWKEFKNAKVVVAGNDLLLINDLHFEISFSSKDVARILKMIQMNI